MCEPQVAWQVPHQHADRLAKFRLSSLPRVTRKGHGGTLRERRARACIRGRGSSQATPAMSTNAGALESTLAMITFSRATTFTIIYHPHPTHSRSGRIWSGYPRSRAPRRSVARSGPRRWDLGRLGPVAAHIEAGRARIGRDGEPCELGAVSLVLGQHEQGRRAIRGCRRRSPRGW